MNRSGRNALWRALNYGLFRNVEIWSFSTVFSSNFQLKWKFLNLIVPSERSNSDLIEYTLFQIEKYKFIYKKCIFSRKMEKKCFFKTHNSKSVHFSIRIMCYVNVWKYKIAICSLVLRRGFWIQCVILVYKLFWWKKQKIHYGVTSCLDNTLEFSLG